MLPIKNAVDLLFKAKQLRQAAYITGLSGKVVAKT